MATWRSCLRSCGEVDGGHAARAELALDAVAVGEGGGESRRSSVHHDLLDAGKPPATNLARRAHSGLNHFSLSAQFGVNRP